MTEPGFAVLLVRATSHAMRLEKVLCTAGLACKLIPVPRHVSSDCGVCVRVRQQDLEAAMRAGEAASIEILSVHPA